MSFLSLDLRGLWGRWVWVAEDLKSWWNTEKVDFFVGDFGGESCRWKTEAVF